MTFYLRIIAGVLLAGVLAGVHVARLPRGKLVVHFLNVGQGDAILMQLPTGENVLLDGGPGPAILQELGSVLPFMDRRIDLMILSHPHADHLAGLLPILERYEVGEVLMTGVDYGSALYTTFLEKKEGDFWTARAEEDYSWGEVTLDVIYPFTSMLGQRVENVNNGTVVVRVLYGEHEILLTGDIEHDVEEELIEAHDRGEVNLRADVLKVAHHGSRSSSIPAFLDRVQADVAIIQSGEGNSFGHPHGEVLERLERRGIEVWRNDQTGRIRLMLAPNERSISSRRS